jgi:hypothetical protein
MIYLHTLFLLGLLTFANELWELVKRPRRNPSGRIDDTVFGYAPIIELNLGEIFENLGLLFQKILVYYTRRH